MVPILLDRTARRRAAGGRKPATHLLYYDDAAIHRPRAEARGGTKARRVSDLLEGGFDSFSRSQEVARYIIDHLDRNRVSERGELARKGNTSSSTRDSFSLDPWAWPGGPRGSEEAGSRRPAVARAPVLWSTMIDCSSVVEELVARAAKNRDM